MKIRLLIALCGVLFMSNKVTAEGENEIKGGTYPYMAFIYYHDETVVEGTGARFQRGAVLVKPEWLVSSAIGSAMTSDITIGFPRKTLLARVGATTIDSKFTLNEDEDEQEREIIQLVRPQNHSATQWWRTDVTLLRTLLPFNLTSVVNIAPLRTKNDYIDNKNCFILVYSKRYGNQSEDKVLMQIYVDLQSADSANCGNHFDQETMLCAVDSSDNKEFDPEFCQGNSGGPLICEDEVTGLQTYIENNCKQPHLYQLLPVWEHFITCGVEGKCLQGDCENSCLIINKDDQIIDETTPEARKGTSEIEETVEVVRASTPADTSEFPDESQDLPRPSLTTLVTTPSTTISTTTSDSTTTTTDTTSTVTSMATSQTEDSTTEGPTNTSSERTLEDDEKVERNTNVEARRSQGKGRNAAEVNKFTFQSLFNLFILACIV